MNDFTKEELATLKNAMEYYSDRTSLQDRQIEEWNGITRKIKSMIDRYPAVYHFPVEMKIGDKIELIPNENGWVIE